MAERPVLAPLGRLPRPSRALRVGLGGLLFFVLVGLLAQLRQALLGASAPVMIDDDLLGQVLLLLIVGLVLTPLLHGLAHRLAASGPPTVATARRAAMAPLALSLLALPLLAVPPVASAAVILIALNTALLASDLIAWLWLRRFPPTALVEQLPTEIVVRPTER